MAACEDFASERLLRAFSLVGTRGDADLLPGDLLFWAYNPGDLSTVHHVAMYLGGGKIVQAPQPGEFVEVTDMWLSGYAGAVRVATGPADTALPATRRATYQHAYDEIVAYLGAYGAARHGFVVER